MTQSESQEPEEFDTEALAHAIVEAAWEAKGLNLRILDVRGIVSYTDFLVVAHGTSERHAQSVAERVIAELRPVKVRPIGTEGLGRGARSEDGTWILVDFADAVLHVFGDMETRRDFDIESIYSDAPRLELEAPEDLEVDAEPEA